MVYTRTSTGAWALEYLHRDHLGSITAVTDATGKMLVEYSYDAWGRQRDPANQLAYAPDKAPELRHGRGYTSHEHLPLFGLVNMNARLYDPVLGRFLSPDPFVQAPDWSQSFNRYSYCGNNPLMYVDEDGELFMGIINFAKDLFVNTFIKPWTQGVNAWTDGNNWESTARGFQVDAGLLYLDANKGFLGRMWELVSRFTWQAPQTVAGYLYSGYNVTTYNAKSVTYYGGATVVETYSGGWGAVTLGSFINGQRGIQANPGNRLFQHEYGHYLQSQAVGWAYLPKYGIPSGLSKKPYDSHPVEQDANRRALQYFVGMYGEQFASTPTNVQRPAGGNSERHGSVPHWDFGYNPILGYNSALGYSEMSNQSALENARLGMTFFDWCIYPTHLLIVGGFGYSAYYNGKY